MTLCSQSTTAILREKTFEAFAHQNTQAFMFLYEPLFIVYVLKLERFTGIHIGTP